jgi:hypothetical protein
MNKELRAKAVESAAARYGAEHYRSILFWQTFGRWWPALLVLAVLAGLVWLLAPAVQAAGDHPNLTGGAVVGGLVLIGLAVLVVRRLRSPYRRRRYR